VVRYRLYLLSTMIHVYLIFFNTHSTSHFIYISISFPITSLPYYIYHMTLIFSFSHGVYHQIVFICYTQFLVLVCIFLMINTNIINLYVFVKIHSKNNCLMIVIWKFLNQTNHFNFHILIFFLRNFN